MLEKKEIEDEKIPYNREVFMRHVATVHKTESVNGMMLSLPATGTGMFFA
jgi:hypothetical protein